MGAKAMTPDRKHPSAALWITVALVAVLVVLVAYPLSFGPACWFADRMPESVQAWTDWFYRPMFWLYLQPGKIGEIVGWWIYLGK